MEIDDDALFEICLACGKKDAMYIGEGDFICESTGEIYNAW